MRFLTDMIDQMAAHIASEVRRREARTSYDAASWKSGMLRNSRRRRRPPGAGMPFPAVPPRGPLPVQDGAEAPLDLVDQSPS